MSDKAALRDEPTPVVFPSFGVFAFESHHGRDFHMEPIRHDYAKILYAIEGCGWLERDQTRIALERNAPLFIPAGLRHRIVDEPGKPLSLYAVCLQADAFAPTAADWIARLPALQLDAKIAGQRWRGYFQRLLYEQTMGNPGRDVIMLGTVYEMVVLLGRRAVPPGEANDSIDKRLEAYLDVLKRTFYRSATLADAAGSVGLGERRFSQLFRARTGSSWLNYVRQLRLSHAEYLLRTTDRSVTSIAFECGFSDLSNFYRAFKAGYQCSPLALRKH